MSWLWFFIGLVVGNVCGWLVRVQVEDSVEMFNAGKNDQS